MIADPAVIPPATAMPDSGVAAPDPPPGYVSFCLRLPDQCAPGPRGPARLNLSPGAWIELMGVNAYINRAIRPMTDLQHYGRAEFWTIPADGYGDCEDYALAKRDLLARLGLPRQALRIAVARTSDGVHAVLTVVTDRGDYVLDNLTDVIRSWDTTGYRWIEWQDPGKSSGWALLDRAPGDVVTASTPDEPAH